MADTKNLYVCIKPYQAGETMTSPSEDPEHWALYLPHGEKGESGPQGVAGPPLWVGSLRELNGGTLTLEVIDGAKVGDYFVVAKTTSGNEGLLGNIYKLSSVGSSAMYASSESLSGNVRGPVGPQGQKGDKGDTGENKISFHEGGGSNTKIEISPGKMYFIQSLDGAIRCNNIRAVAAMMYKTVNLGSVDYPIIGVCWEQISGNGEAKSYKFSTDEIIIESGGYVKVEIG